MRNILAAALSLCGVLCVDVRDGGSQPFPSAGSPNPAMTGAPAKPPAEIAPPATAQSQSQPQPAPPAPSSAGPLPAGSVPRAVTIARATEIPRCTLFVDAAAAARGDGTAQRPHKTIAAAVAAASNGAVICVAEGTYPEQIKPGEKSFTLAGGFQRGQNFTVRDSARYVSRAVGRGSGSFIRYEDPGPKDNQLTVIDGFDISGYEQAIFRDIYYSQRFDITNNHIHDNKCGDTLAGAGITLNNVSGRIQGNVFRNNSCGRGGALFVQDSEKKSVLLIANNLVDNNHGTEPGASHGGAFYLFGTTLTLTGNLFTNNSVTQWGGGLYVGAWTEGGYPTTATMSWNVYRGNRAGNGGGGFFCDDGATCISEHEVYDRNCGSNILLDGGSETSSGTTARFSYMTNVGALAVGCGGPGAGVRIDKNAGAPDTYSFTNSIFWGNAPGLDFAEGCALNCSGRILVSHSMVQTDYLKQGDAKITFGPGIMAPADPLFAAPAQGDFHLKSTAGRWTPAGYVQDSVTSPAVAKGDPASPANQNPERAGRRSELGAYGNSGEASYVR